MYRQKVVELEISLVEQRWAEVCSFNGDESRIGFYRAACLMFDDKRITSSMLIQAILDKLGNPEGYVFDTQSPRNEAQGEMIKQVVIAQLASLENQISYLGLKDPLEITRFYLGVVSDHKERMMVSGLVHHHVSEKIEFYSLQGGVPKDPCRTPSGLQSPD